MFRYLFTTIFRVSSAVLCAVTIPPADLRSLSLYYYAVCGHMCMSSVYRQQDQLITEQQINELNPLYELAQLPHTLRNSSQADHQQTRTPNTHR